MSENFTNPSFTNPNYTFHFDKYSCVREFYFIHVTFCYLVFLSGLFCLITRLVPRVYFMHVWFGRIYILSMLWATATSLLIHNTGLPLAVLLSFVWVMLGLTIGWILIKFHQEQMQSKAAENLKLLILKIGLQANDDMNRLLLQEKIKIATGKSFAQRVLSLKAAHGLLMFISWFNIMGRIFASDQSGQFTCHTYPAYKPINTKEGNFAGKPLTLVEERNPRYDRLPWANMEAGWMAILFFAPAFAFGIFGGIVAWRGSRINSKKPETVELNTAFGGNLQNTQ